MNTVRVLLLRMVRIIRVPQLALKYLVPMVLVVITEVSKLQRNYLLCVCVGTRNGEIITFGLRHCLALLLSQAIELREGRVTK